MRIAYFDCFSGISGDMALAALIDAGAKAERVAAAVQSLGLDATLQVEQVTRGGLRALRVTVQAAAEQPHRRLADIRSIIGAGRLTDRQRQLANGIFTRLAEAEAAVHGIAPEQVHFHEVGAVDSIVDVVGAAVAVDLLGVDQIQASPVATGCGSVQTAHGRLPVPAPATAELLKGVPLTGGEVRAELTTPTGAAILTTVCSQFGPLPEMCLDAVGHGAGQRELAEGPNLLRLFVGSATATGQTDAVWVLETNLDDLPGELVGYCTEQLLAAGALDVFTAAIAMKKNRPGVLLSVICPEEKISDLERVLFRQTATFGIRRYRATRSKLQRRQHVVSTPYGPVTGKLGWRPGVPAVFSPEYECCRRLAQEHGLPLRELYAAAIRAFDPETVSMEDGGKPWTGRS